MTPTVEPPSTGSTAQTDTRATSDSATIPPNTQPPNPTYPPTEAVLPSPDSGYVIYAAGGFAGAICILLVVVIIVVVICIVQKRKHRTYQYGNGFKFGSPSKLFIDTYYIFLAYWAHVSNIML